MVQVMTTGELTLELAKWDEAHGGRCYTVARYGNKYTLIFEKERDFVLFILSFKPKQEHWWRNARIER